MVTERGAIVMTKSKANRSTGDAVPHITSDPIEDGAAANRSIALNPFAPLAFAIGPPEFVNPSALLKKMCVANAGLPKTMVVGVLQRIPIIVVRTPNV
jgi:hypothetical protein